MKKLMIGPVAALLLLVAGSATAQTVCTSNCTKLRNQAFNVLADWAPDATNPDAADGFRLYQSKDGSTPAVVSQLGASATATTLTYSFGSGLSTAGVYVFYVAAFNSGGEAVSPNIQLTISQGKPASPKNPRITWLWEGPTKVAASIGHGFRRVR